MWENLTHIYTPWVGFLANVITFLFMLNPLREFLYLLKIHPPPYVPHLPYAMMFGNYLMWVLFGIAIQDTYIWVPNITGAILSVYYIFKLAAAVWEDSRTRSTLRYCSSFVVIGLLLLVLLKQEVITEQMLGYSASCFSIALFASPLLDLNRVITTRSTEGLSLSSSVLTVLLTSCWTLYGILTNNSSIILPNVLGCFLAFSQLLLFGVLGSHKPMSNNIV